MKYNKEFYYLGARANRVKPSPSSPTPSQVPGFLTVDTVWPAALSQVPIAMTSPSTLYYISNCKPKSALPSLSCFLRYLVREINIWSGEKKLISGQYHSMQFTPQEQPLRGREEGTG